MDSVMYTFAIRQFQVVWSQAFSFQSQIIILFANMFNGFRFIQFQVQKWLLNLINSNSW